MSLENMKIRRPWVGGIGFLMGKMGEYFLRAQMAVLIDQLY